MHNYKHIRQITLFAAFLFLISSCLSIVFSAEVEEISKTYPMKKVIVKGSYYDIGFQLGSYAKDAGVKTKKMTEAEKEKLSKLKVLYESIHPGFVDELRGIWAAFGLNYDDMEFDIDQVLYLGQKVGWLIKSDILKAGCSIFSVPSDGTGDRSVIVGRNLDWADRMSCSLIFKYPEGAYASVGCTSWDVGLSLLDGMNSKGLSISVAVVPDLGSPQPVPGLVHLMAVRVMLDTCKDVNEAVDFLKTTKVSFPVATIHFFIADKSGKAVVVEFVGKDIVIVEPSNKFHLTTNYYLTNNVGVGQDRYAIARNMLNKQYGSIDYEYAGQVLNAVKQWGTQWSVIYDLTNSRFRIALADNLNKFYDFNFDGGMDTITSVESNSKLSTTWGRIKRAL